MYLFKIIYITGVFFRNKEEKFHNPFSYFSETNFFAAVNSNVCLCILLKQDDFSFTYYLYENCIDTEISGAMFFIPPPPSDPGW